jgi:hypothetical protein
VDLFSPEAFPRKIAWSVGGRLATAAAVLFLPRMVGRGEAQRDLHLYGSEACTHPAYFRIAETRQQRQATIEDRGNVIAAIAAPMLGLLYVGPMP